MSAPPLRLPRKEILAVNCWLAPTAMAVLPGVICKRTGPTCARQESASANSKKNSISELCSFVTVDLAKTYGRLKSHRIQVTHTLRHKTTSRVAVISENLVN